MHFHYYMLCQVAGELPRGEGIEACFSQTRNELILEFNSFFLRIGCNTPLTYFVPVTRFSRARKNVVNLFPELIGKTVTSWEVVPYDRIVILHLDGNYRLVAKMHASQANVLLFQGDSRLASFNQQMVEADTFDFPPEDGRLQHYRLFPIPAQKMRFCITSGR